MPEEKAKKQPTKKSEKKPEANSKSVFDSVFDEVAAKKDEDKVEKKGVKKVAKPKGKKKKKAIKHVAVGNVYIQATYNNTLVTFADQNGNVIGQGSAGRCGFKGPKKATPYAAGVIVKDVVGRIAPYGVKDVRVYIKGVGLGREAAVRALNANGINVLSIKDVTPIPHNGCRQKKPRRV
jgi:small subunit ribosomal protein S11